MLTSTKPNFIQVSTKPNFILASTQPNFISSFNQAKLYLASTKPNFTLSSTKPNWIIASKKYYQNSFAPNLIKISFNRNFIKTKNKPTFLIILKLHFDNVECWCIKNKNRNSLFPEDNSVFNKFVILKVYKFAHSQLPSILCIVKMKIQIYFLRYLNIYRRILHKKVIERNIHNFTYILRKKCIVHCTYIFKILIMNLSLVE